MGRRGLGPPPHTPEPGGGGRVASLPAGLLPGQLVTFPVRSRAGIPPASPGQGLARAPAPEAAEQSGPAVTHPRPPLLLFHLGRTRRPAGRPACSPPPTKPRFLGRLSPAAAHSAQSREEGGRGGYPLGYFVPQSPVPTLPHHGGGGCRSEDSDVIPTSPQTSCVTLRL